MVIKSSSFAGFLLIAVAIGFIGYAANIVQMIIALQTGDFNETSELVYIAVQVVGICFPPLGALLGYVGMF